MIWPYLAGFGALGLARATSVTGDARYAQAGWRWLSWYQAHQDADGFVTDYVVENGVERSTGDMDSTDSYAGMFLLAARRTWKVTRDSTRLVGLAAGIDGAVRAIEATQDIDGLTWAKPTWHVKYLMDQSETFRAPGCGRDGPGTGQRVPRLTGRGRCRSPEGGLRPPVEPGHGRLRLGDARERVPPVDQLGAAVPRRPPAGSARGHGRSRRPSPDA